MAFKPLTRNYWLDRKIDQRLQQRFVRKLASGNTPEEYYRFKSAITPWLTEHQSNLRTYVDTIYKSRKWHGDKEYGAGAGVLADQITFDREQFNKIGFDSADYSTLNLSKLQNSLTRFSASLDKLREVYRAKNSSAYDMGNINVLRNSFAADVNCHAVRLAEHIENQTRGR